MKYQKYEILRNTYLKVDQLQDLWMSNKYLRILAVYFCYVEIFISANNLSVKSDT